MQSSSTGVFAGIGNTPLVELRRVVPSSGARIVAKLEWANPTGSMKDRMARTAIEGAIRDGRLHPGDTVVEYTAGTTGISPLSYVPRSGMASTSSFRTRSAWRNAAR